MKKTIVVSLRVVVILALCSAARVQADQIECGSWAPRVKAVTAPGQHVAQVDFSASGGNLDSVSLLSASVNVSGRGASCLVAHFSTLASPQDNGIVFQVRVDGVPMEGHGQVPGFATPVVFDPEETDPNLPRMVSYNFFAEVLPGPHTVEVLYAGCCSANPDARSGVVQSPVLTLQYR
jgi:hypothetical protein